MRIIVFSVLITQVLGQIDILWERHGYAPIYDGSSSIQSNIQTGVVSQPLNHQPMRFWARRLNWNMRYMYNDQFYDGTGPLFVLIGGQYNMYTISNYLSEGFIYDLAKEMKAYMCVPEHRFYGESIPDGDLRGTNLEYLGYRQVLADLANFIQKLQANNPKLQSAQVVLFGVGYAGTLATWMRMDYPDLVNLAVASGAPLQFTNDFYQFFQSVQSVLDNFDGCTDSLTNAFSALDALLQSESGQTKVKGDFNFCNTPNFGNSQQVKLFFKQLAAIIGNRVKYGTEETIGLMCHELCKPCIVDDYTRLLNYVNLTFGTDCFPNYNDIVTSLLSTNTAADRMTRQWLYQICTQIGSFETTRGKIFAINVPIDFYYKLCTEIFGFMATSFRLQTEQQLISMAYRGKNLRVTNVIFTQGSYDPYKTLGLTRTISELNPVVVIDGVGHGADMLPKTVNDPQALVNGRSTIKQYIKYFLNN